MTSSFEPFAPGTWGGTGGGRAGVRTAVTAPWRPPSFGDEADTGVVALTVVPAEAALDAYARGVADGRREERAVVEAGLDSALAALTGLVARFGEAAAAARRDRERDLEAIAVAMARRLLLREVAADPDIVADLVRRGLELAPFDAPLGVRLNPADLEPIRGRLDTLLPAGHGADVEWIADALIERGGFRIDAPARLIDGRTDVSLRALYDRLDDV